MRGNPHVRFGGRAEETDPPKGGHRASARSNHTAASQMLMAGVPLSVVAERLGCTEGNILRTYRHYIPGSDRDAAALMDRMFDDDGS